jgi:hypothetical protein
VSDYSTIIIPGEFLNDGTFSYVEFETLVVDIPKEFLSAAWGYGHYYGRHYGHT